MSVKLDDELNGYYYQAATHAEAAVDGAELGRLQDAAKQDFAEPKVSYLLDDEQSQTWTNNALTLGLDLPEGFAFNRGNRIYVESGFSYWMPPH